MQFLRRLREDKKLGSNQTAKLLNVSHQSYHYYEREANGCLLQFLVKVKHLFNISWCDLGKLIEEEVNKGKKE